MKKFINLFIYNSGNWDKVLFKVEPENKLEVSIL